MVLTQRDDAFSLCGFLEGIVGGLHFGLGIALGAIIGGVIYDVSGRVADGSAALRQKAPCPPTTDRTPYHFQAKGAVFTFRCAAVASSVALVALILNHRFGRRCVDIENRLLFRLNECRRSAVFN
jgi:hypothetical protein